MRFWILVFLPVLFLLGCHDKVTPTNPNDGTPLDSTSHIPIAPANLRVQFFVGRGIAVSWDDRSNNERWFMLAHGLVGQDLSYDTLPANTVFYFDSVGLAEAYYFYKVRAGNDSGWSAWTATLDVNYRLASDGLIPLRAGNFWEYRVDSAQTHHNFRRSVYEMRLVGGEDWYLLADSLMSGGTLQGRFYLRNGSESTTLLNFPLDSALQTDTLFRYPHTHSGESYDFQQDSMVVLNPPPGVTLPHVGPGDSTYTGVVSFQSFLNRDRRNSIQYFMVPNRIGLIREVEFLNGDTAALRDIVNYQVLN